MTITPQASMWFFLKEVSMTKFYDYYTEPCQLCIERSSDGRGYLVDECGWCNDSDTYHSEALGSPGNIIKISGETGYPYHKSAHPKRRYFLNGGELPQLIGTNPIDTSSTKDEKSAFEPLPFYGKYFLISFVFSFVVFLSKLIAPDFSNTILFAGIASTLISILFLNKGKAPNKGWRINEGKFPWGTGICAFLMIIIMSDTYVNEFNSGILASIISFSILIFLSFCFRRFHFIPVIVVSIVLSSCLITLSHVIL